MNVTRYNLVTVKGKTVLRKAKYGTLVKYEDVKPLERLASLAEDIADKVSFAFDLHSMDACDDSKLDPYM